MAKIIRNGIEYGIPSYSKNEIDRKLALKVSKSEVESELNESTNPVQSRAVKKALGDKVPQYTTMPMPNVNNVGAVAQYVGTTTVDFTNGFFYEVVEDSSSVPTIYSWQPKNVQNGTSIFYGTMDEWNALTSTEQAKYDLVASPDEASEDIADEVTDGDMRPVTSNAVYDFYSNKWKHLDFDVNSTKDISSLVNTNSAKTVAINVTGNAHQHAIWIGSLANYNDTYSYTSSKVVSISGIEISVSSAGVLTVSGMYYKVKVTVCDF